jgi:hypothetical protein
MFQLLYCFFAIERGRRKMLNFNITRHPAAERVVQQLRETFPDFGPYHSQNDPVTTACQGFSCPKCPKSERQNALHRISPPYTSPTPRRSCKKV